MDSPVENPLNVIVPIKLDAFVLNSKVCSGNSTEAKIAPITQPNYTFLRIDKFAARNDVLKHVDLHETSPADVNSRFTDLGARPLTARQNRVGVYLHWTIPRGYRAGAADTESENGDVDPSAPKFPPIPTRWLVIRHTDMKSIPEGVNFPEVQGWVIESDRKRDIDDLDAEKDLQVDVSPFIYSTHVEGSQIDHQAEVFIGYKADADAWKEDMEDEKIQRVQNLTLLTSSNPLFADYQPQNSNVFSMVDNFEYIDTERTTKNNLPRAKASYYVIGWHSIEKEDPFNTSQELQKRLDDFRMTLKTDTKSPLLKSTEPGRVVCHGAMYDVEWNTEKKPNVVPADNHSKHLCEKMPVAIGTTPMDALISYVQAHKDFDDGDIKRVEMDLWSIQSLLLATDDGVESQKEAVDTLYNHNYDRLDCGTHFYLSGVDEGKPTEQPSEKQQTNLLKLNQVQLALDLTTRTIQRLRWEIFSLWWRYVSDGGVIDGTDALRNQSKTDVQGLSTRLGTLAALSGKLQSRVKALRCKETGLENAKPGVLPSAFRQRDPTLLVGGIPSGWPQDFMDQLKVRLGTSIISGDAKPFPAGWDTLSTMINTKLPRQISQSASKLSEEFLLLMPGKKSLDEQKEKFPLYHDTDSPDSAMRDTWGGKQPWFPLFLEWEVEYTHIPIDDWTLEERKSGPFQTPKLRYGIKETIDLVGAKIEDKRTLSGRVLILPQPTFSLETKVKSLIEATPQDILEKCLNKDEQDFLKTKIRQLAFLSAPLTGLTDHLLTLVQGTHIKPNKRTPGKKLELMGEIVTPQGKLAGFTDEALKLIEKESDLTPYASLVQNSQDKHAFKPVTHGQFKFIKINIIDKFGQAIHAIDPVPTPNPQYFYPCISEFYTCQLRDGVPNTVEPREDGVEPNLSQFVQLPPKINQFARLNSAFVVADNDHWRPATEWENPVWGWIVTNYAESGIQLFLPDGTFYREVRLGGALGTATSAKWLPFPEPGKFKAPQLDELIKRLANKDYLQAFIDMVNGALKSGRPAPSAYAQFLNSVVGKPLALVNMGWSLELAVSPYTNQSTSMTQPEQSLLKYGFHVRLGHRDKVYDGLVGYFKMDDKEHAKGTELNLNDLYTFFTSEDKTPLRAITKDNYPTFNPFWVNPEGRGEITEKNLDSYTDSITTDRNKKLSVFGALIDPFIPVHGYSSFLPTEVLTLPSWTWQSAMEKMTAFFHIGPLIVTENVPKFESTKTLKPDYNYKDNIPESAGTISVPALGLGDWDWFQPYEAEPTAEETYEGQPKGEWVYNPLKLKTLDNRPRFEEGPYTAVEGYLQLKKPIVRPA